MSMEGKISIKEYFRGKNIFITGGTGFLGKALIEKLLRSCPDLNKLYILLRPKKGKNLQERINDIISSPVFSLLKKNCPKNFNKIIPIGGDIKELQLGISEEDRQLLKEQIHFFFHAAASVRFNDFLRDAIITNLRSAREVALLALQMKNLNILVHVSTTYCNMDQKTVEEKLYPPHGNWKDLIMVAENCDMNILNVLSEKVVGTLPNTYTYTKQLAEHCINDLLGGKIPTTIIYRPSVVIGSFADPYQGWGDNMNGPAGFVAGIGSGVLKILYANPTVKLDVIPVDFVIKSILVATWYTDNFGNKNTVDVFHGSSHNLLEVSFKKLEEYENKLIWLLPLQKCIWYPTCIITTCWIYYYIGFILLQAIPATILDLVIKITGNRPMMVKLQRRVYIGILTGQPFMTNAFNFTHTKTFSLLEKIQKVDMQDFNFSMLPTTTDSKDTFFDYFFIYCAHLKKHVLKQDGDINLAYASLLKKYYLHKFCLLIFYGLLIWIAFSKLSS